MYIYYTHVSEGGPIPVNDSDSDMLYSRMNSNSYDLKHTTRGGFINQNILRTRDN